MLNTVFFKNEISKDTPCVILLGGFDGAHLGHRALVARAKKSGLPVGITTIFGGKGQTVFTRLERRALFQEIGVDFLLEFSFEKIRSLAPSEFSSLITSQFFVQTFYCGEDFRYGYLASGTPETLKKDTRVCVEAVQLIKRQGEKVSSATVKTHLLQGKIEQANSLLDCAFFLSGIVQRDRGVGKTLGFPTANVPYPQEKTPLKQGVYQTRVEIDGVSYRAMTNYGSRPTFDNENVVTETYIDGFKGELYGKLLTIRFERFLREVQRFSSVEELTKQLEKDIRRVREND